MTLTLKEIDGSYIKENLATAIYVTSTVVRSGDYGPSARGSVKPDL